MNNSKIISIFKKLSLVLAIITSAVGFIVLSGWLFHVPAIKGMIPGMPVMSPNTALSFLIAGVSLWLLNHTGQGSGNWSRILAHVIAAIVTLTGLLTLIQYIYNVNFGIDQLLFKDLAALYTRYPGRMSPHTAVSFIFAGLSLIMIDVEIRKVRPSQITAILSGFIALMAIVGYAYDIRTLYSLTYESGMALHTAATFIILCLGILSSRPEKGFMATVTSNSIGGYIARRLLPAAIFLPLIIGWLRLSGERAGFYSFEFGLFLFALSNIVLFVFIIWRYSDRIDIIDTNRIHAEESLRKVNRALKTLSSCNMIIVRATDENELLNSLCRVIVDSGGYRMCWVGFTNNNNKNIKPVAQSGLEEGYLDTVNIAWDDNERGRGPTGTAIRTGRYALCKDIITNPDFAPWREEAIRRGYASSIALPLIHIGSSFGALNIYASEPDAFDEEEIRLLLELAGDLSYGIMTLRTHIKQKELDEENHLLETIIISMAGADDMKAAVEIALKKICDITKWDYAETWAPDPDGKILISGNAYYSKAFREDIDNFRIRSEGFTFAPGIGLPGRVWSSKQPEWIRNVSINGHVYLRSDIAMSAGFRSSLAVPIVCNSHVLAVLVFYMSDVHPWDERQVKMITAVAAQLGSVIQRKKAEDDRIKLEEQLLHAQKMEAIGRLTGGIAHDFNNLLTAIIGNASLIEMKTSGDSRIMNYVRQIIATSERAANLTKSLLTFSRKQIIDIRPVALNDIIKGVGKLLSNLIGEDIDLRIRLSDDDIVISADSGQIEQVLMNLATNARDAMPEGGILSIESGIVQLDDEFTKTHAYGDPGMHALVTVTDTGSGMDDKTLKRIFEPFFTTKETHKGTGLGLSIVYGIIQQHNGYINVYSEPGKGTTFKIYLPLTTSQTLERGTAGYTVPVGGTETILIAEDEEYVRSTTKNILEKFGYNIIEAVDGEEAITRFAENRDNIRLLILDTVMPKKNGKEVYDEIRRSRPDIKTIFISGYNEEIIHSKGVLDEGLHFISKPFVPTMFLRKVREVLDRLPLT